MSRTSRIVWVVADLPELYRAAAEEFVARMEGAVRVWGLATVALTEFFDHVNDAHSAGPP